MAGKAVRSRHPRSFAHRTRRPFTPTTTPPHRDGHQPPGNGGRPFDPPPMLIRTRTRTDLPWYAKELRRRGRRTFGWTFAVVCLTPTARGAQRVFLRFAAICLVVAVLTVASLILLPSAPIALGGTAVFLLEVAFLSWMVGDDDRRTRHLTDTDAQLTCVASLAAVGAIAMVVALWAVTVPLADATIKLFGLYGIVVYFGLLVVLLVLLLAGLMAALTAAARSFLWTNANLLVLPVIPLAVIVLVALTRLGLG